MKRKILQGLLIYIDSKRDKAVTPDQMHSAAYHLRTDIQKYSYIDRKCGFFITTFT